ncbi:MAG: sigma-70 family RNA polymerase sigma factor [Pirellulales bacterium]|nr:sigma-70 family RNA polymerase sigma factor [Pirellulales bacterium]
MNGPIDAEQLGRLLDEHGAALALYASQWTFAADDCVQEAIIELARQPQAPAYVVAWLYRVVKHRALNAGRGERRRRVREARAMAERFAELHHSQGHQHDGSHTAIAALQDLDPADRELVVMRIWGGLTFDEIAAVLAVSTATAHRHYEQAIGKLRKRLEMPCSTNTNRPNSN